MRLKARAWIPAVNGPSRPFLMRRQATIALCVVLVLLGNLLHVTPAYAGEPVAADRSHVVLAWQEGGPLVREAAEAALLGTDEQVGAFLAEGWDRARRLDERDQLAGVISDGGPALRAKAQAALEADAAGDEDAIAAFLKNGWQGPADIDVRVSVNQLMSAGGEEVKQAAQAVLDQGDPGKLREFLESGWQTQWNSDQRLRINQIMATGGPHVRTAAQKALDAETPEALEAFFSYGWAVASARDDETATLQDLLGQAEAAGELAEQETAGAVEEAGRADDAAAAARRSAAEAAAATEAARGDRAEAKAQAKRAATAANKAVAAARVAVQAAAAADRAARAAAGAAARAAQLASRANQKAAEAYRAAAEASVDASRANVARQAAQAANAIAQEARDIAVSAQAAANALENGQKAVQSAVSAAEHAMAAAAANEDAVRYANAAGAEAGEAVAAAARARANAARALRAARAAENHLRVAISAANKARDAANRAAANAQAAATAALEAAEHAGDAAEAAKRSTEHANAAVDAAQQALETAEQAAAVYAAARTADAERLAVARDEGLEIAREANTQYEEQQRIADWDVDQAAKRDEETDRLIEVARAPATERADAVAAARKAALNLASGQGAWTKEAARAALGSNDDLVLEFVRTGLPRAEARDNRLAVTNLGVTENAALAAAAKDALAGSDEEVAAFLRTQTYPGRYSADRLEVNRILSEARATGDVVLAERAQQALDADTPQALRDFLDTGRYTAALTGERVLVNQILADPDSGPETRAAAQIALDGPAPGLRKFLDSGHHAAAERDHENAVHLAVVAGLLKKIDEVAETALESALEAQSVAARARGDAEQAAGYAQQAIAAAQRAAGYAEQADAHADRAAASANKAAAAVKTAREAATRARASARSAVRSATWAIASYERAVAAANRAGAAARTAYREAVRAGEDAEAAVEAATEASEAHEYAVGVAIVDCYHQYSSDQYQRLEDVYDQEGQFYRNCVENILGSPEDLATRAYVNSGFCDLYPQDSQDYQNCLNSVLDPAFVGTQQLTVTLQALQYGAAWFFSGFVPLAAGCLANAVCGAALTVAQVGMEIHRLVKGDQGLGKTLLKIGVIALEELVFYGIGKLISAGFRAIKNAATAGRASSSALSKLQVVLVRTQHKRVLAEVRAMRAGDYSSVKDTAFFWSGRTKVGPDKYRNAGPDEAAVIAKSHNGTTLEILMDSRGIPQAKWSDEAWPEIQRQVNDAWDQVSLAYARGASGEVKVVLGQDVREQSVWLRHECKELLKNPRVTKITAIDLTTRKPRVITNESECLPVEAPLALQAA